MQQRSSSTISTAIGDLSDLWELARSGNEQARTALCAQLVTILKGVMAKLRVPPPIREDVSQEVIRSILENFETIPNPSNHLGFIWWRTRSCFAKVQRNSTSAWSVEGHEAATESADPGSPPWLRMASAEQKATLLKCRAGLPEKLQIAVTKRHRDSLKASVIALQCGVSSVTIHTRLKSAYALLLRCMISNGGQE